MNTMKRGVLGLIAIATLGAGGCVSSGGSAGGSAAAPAEEEGVRHVVSDAERAMLTSPEPVSTDMVVLYVNGMGCPLCVTNVDKQVERLDGVDSVKVDLGAGTVDVALSGESRPSPRDFERAVKDAGNTLAKIEMR